MENIFNLKEDWYIAGILGCMVLLLTMFYWLPPVAHFLTPLLDWFYGK